MTLQVNTIHKNSNATSFKGGAVYTVGNFVEKKLTTIGNFSTPTSRLFLGATALALQPEIDLHNKDVDEKTRRISWARTIAKTVVGTITGIAIRQGCIDAMDWFTRTPKEIAEMEAKGKKIPKWAKALIPDKVKIDGKYEDFSHESFAKAERLLIKHRKALGSIVALGVMVFTNFLIDAPLTRILTNKISKWDNEKRQQSAPVKEGEQA